MPRVRTVISLVGALGVAACATHPDARIAADGTLLSSEAFCIRTPYDEQSELTRFRFPREVYERAANDPRFVSTRITYASDGLRITGVLVQPRETPSHPLPTILYCRGGTADFGALDESDLVTFHEWANLGFVVLASNYRGGGGSDGVDTWCGDDVHDVLALVPLARSFPAVDADNLFLVGLSRGGPMVYGALRDGIRVRAAAVMAGVSDLMAEDMLEREPEFADGDDDVFRAMGWRGWRSVWPDYDHRAEEHKRARSAICWPEKLRVPLLLLHAKDDPRVPATHSERLAAALQRIGAAHELVLYDHDGHSLPLHREDRDQRIAAWFRRHLTPVQHRRADSPPPGLHERLRPAARPTRSSTR